MNAVNEFELGAMAHPHGRIAVLISRYPDISGREADEIAAFVRSARRRDLGRLLAADAVRPKLERFMADHDYRFRSRLTDRLWIGVAILAIVAACLALWERRPHALSFTQASTPTHAHP